MDLRLRGPAAYRRQKVEAALMRATVRADKSAKQASKLECSISPEIASPPLTDNE